MVASGGIGCGSGGGGIRGCDSDLCKEIWTDTTSFKTT